MSTEPDFYQTVKAADGSTFEMLRPYWRRRPIVEPNPAGGLVDLAFWPDGLASAVPRGAKPYELAGYWAAAVMLLAAERISASPALQAHIQRKIDRARRPVIYERGGAPNGR